MSCNLRQRRGCTAAQVKSLAVENAGMQARTQAALEQQRRRALEAVRCAERSRAHMLCEKAAAEHDLVQVRAHWSRYLRVPVANIRAAF